MTRPRLPALGVVAARELTRRKARSAAVIVGVALGVAINFGVAVANATSAAGRAAVTSAVTRALAGNAQIVVSPVGSQAPVLGLGVVRRVAALPGVAGAVPQVVLDAFVGSTPTSYQARIQLDAQALGATGDVQQVQLLAGQLPSHESEIVLPAPLVGGAGSIGQTVFLDDPSSPGTSLALRVTGIGLERPPEVANLGFVGYTSLQAGLRLLGPDAGFSHVLVHLSRGVDPAAWIRANPLGPGIWASTATAYYAALNSASGALQLALSGVGAVALFVSLFLVYLTMSTRVLERTRLLGGLYALGAQRRQVVGLVLGEALGIGLAAGVLGILLGLGIGAAIAALTASLVGADYAGLRVPLDAVPAVLAAGLVMTLLGALVPARRASRLSPVEAIRSDQLGGRRLSRWWVLGAALGVVGLALGRFVGRHPLLLWLALLTVLLGAVLVVPAAVRPLASLVGRFTRRLSPGVGSVAVMHVVRERSRSAYTLSLLMVVMAVAISVASGLDGLHADLETALRAQYGGDLKVYVAGSAAPALAIIRSTPGVRAATAIGDGPAADYIVGRPAVAAGLEFVDPGSYFSAAGFDFRSGNAKTAEEALASGHGVLLPWGAAAPLRIRAGQTITLQTAVGPRPFLVGGIYLDDVTPTDLVLSLAEGRTYYRTAVPSEVIAAVAPGAGRAVIVRVDQELGASFDGYVGYSLPSQQAARIRQQVDGLAETLFGALAVTGAIAILGLTTTLVMAVIDRTREIGLLRALGVGPRGIAEMILVETAALWAAAFALALLLGGALSELMHAALAQSLGHGVPLHYPWTFTPVVGTVSAVASLGAAALPIRRSRRLTIALALRVD